MGGDLGEAFLCFVWCFTCQRRRVDKARSVLTLSHGDGIDVGWMCAGESGTEAGAVNRGICRREEEDHRVNVDHEEGLLLFMPCGVSLSFMRL